MPPQTLLAQLSPELEALSQVQAVQFLVGQVLLEVPVKVLLMELLEMDKVDD
jgi:hypothetical protein